MNVGQKEEHGRRESFLSGGGKGHPAQKERAVANRKRARDGLLRESWEKRIIVFRERGKSLFLK